MRLLCSLALLGVLLSTCNSKQMTPSNTIINIGNSTFNLTSFAQNGAFSLEDILNDNLTFSLGSSVVQKCSGNGTVWATYQDDLDACYDIATQNPDYTLLDQDDPNQGLTITFPPEFRITRYFQLIINLACDMNVVSPSATPFTVSISDSEDEDLETVTVNGSSINACLISDQTTNSTQELLPSDFRDNCGAITINSGIFNICSLANSTFNVPDLVGGELSFALGGESIQDCSGEGNVWAVYNDNLHHCYEAANENPTLSLYNETDPDQGLQITFPIAISNSAYVRSFQLIVNLLCDNEQVGLSSAGFIMNLMASGPDMLETIEVTAYSIYGCQIDPDTTIEI